MLIGGALGRHKGGGVHIAATGSTANLLLSAVQMFGIEKDSVGDSAGTVSL